MIEFLTLFVGLFAGSHAVHLQATDEVAAVEILLDGELVERLEEPPWSSEVDFGESLLPHELVAIARDHQGREMDRRERRINLSQTTFAGRMELLRDDSGWPRAVRLGWESLGWRGPRQASIYFDEQKLAFEDIQNIPLPAYDREQMHFLEATLRFDARHVSHLEASFGGILGSEVSSGLTVTAVALKPGNRMPKVESLGGALVRRGKPLVVHGVEKGLAEVAFVIAPGADALLQRVEQGLSRSRLRSVLNLGSKGQIRVLDPQVALLTGQQISPELFLHTQPQEATGGFLWLDREQPPAARPTSLADAVALAGLEAYSTQRRRAVVLLLADTPPDVGTHRPAQVQEYLNALQVPLFVWSFQGAESQPEWGSARHLQGSGSDRALLNELQGAMRDLRRSLDDQRLIWVQGEHLPQEIQLDRESLPLRIIGR